MPTKREIAREMLQNWESWEEISKVAGDGSGTYEELREFLATKGKQTIVQVREQKKQLEELETLVNENLEIIDTQKIELSKQENANKQLTQTRSSLVSENKGLEKRNMELNALNNELVEKGVDDSVIKKVKEFDHQDKEELVQRIMTFKDFKKLQNEILTLEETRNSTLKIIEENRATIFNQEEDISRLTKETEKLEAGFERARKIADIANLAVEYGYSPEAFESLLETIEKYIDITPYVTNKQVFLALQEYQSLEHIRSETRKASQENQAIINQLEKTRGDLDAIKNNTVAALSEVSYDSKIKIRDTAKEAETNTSKLYEQHKGLLDLSEARLTKFWENMENRNKQIEERLKELAQIELLLKNSMVITTAYYNPEAAKNIPIRDISVLATVVDYWVG